MYQLKLCIPDHCGGESGNKQTKQRKRHFVANILKNYELFKRGKKEGNDNIGFPGLFIFSTLFFFSLVWFFVWGVGGVGGVWFGFFLSFSAFIQLSFQCNKT